jgi:hypothetical protein
MKRFWERSAHFATVPVALLVIAWLTSSAVSAPSGAAAPAAPALSWQDVTGKRYGAADLAGARATVFLFTSTQCPISNRYAPRIVELAKQYQPRGIRFFLVNSNREDSRETVARDAKERGFPFPAVKDTGTALADRLNAQCTPQAIVLDGTGAIRYTGRIDDHQDREQVARQDLREALDALLAGRPVAQARTLPFGCAIFREASTSAPPGGARATVTYARDVARILNDNCVVCHRQGEVAPFALETFEQARVWARQIKEYTARRLMPPWKPVAGFGEFHDARSLTDAQIAALARWAESGAPRGNAREIPAPPRFPAPDAWLLGTPDVVLSAARPYHLAAEGKDVYRNFVLPIEFEEDRFVSAIEFQPDNRRVVHHIVTYIDPTGASTKLDGREEEPGYTVPGVGIGVDRALWGEVWVPGNSPRFLPHGVALRIPKGARLVMQVHYHKTGKPEVDRSRMAIHYAKGKVERQILTIPIGAQEFELKPGSDRQEVRASLTLPVPATLWSIFPHMHMLGREMKVTARLPDGTVKPLVYINDWDFNWQATYFYKEPIDFPPGTRLDLLAVYDNSERNPRQTSHPPRVVRFGEQTTDEMCFAFLGLSSELLGRYMPGGDRSGPRAAPGP